MRMFNLDDTGTARQALQITSPNSDERPIGTVIDLVVIHNISLPPGEFGGDGVVELFTNRLDPAEHPYYAEIHQFKVSSHFFVRRSGEVIQFVPCGKRAWHAGVSQWQGRERCNDFSIGIELEGDDTTRFEDVQYATLEALLTAIEQRYPIAGIVGHSDIAPGRKTDPGPFFDWTRINRSQKDCRRTI
ncbi:MAG TPA: 1,6-anhydro-N-acetylmuramyl-L-alanine amidase AmpD [Methylophilaceae bacterium]|nr:1,6-anhydro-N-acetylmuramyl-L-alanine amidase AmpD [Methylophilaceae bacterium]